MPAMLIMHMRRRRGRLRKNGGVIMPMMVSMIVSMIVTMIVTMIVRVTMMIVVRMIAV